jgi:hypothetical protein
MRLVSCGERQRRGTSFVLILVYLSACQGWHTVRVAPESLLATREPAKVRVTTTDGSQIVVEQPVLRGDTLIGTSDGHNQQHEVRVPLTDVRAVATRGVSAGRTVGLVLIAVPVAFGVFLVIFFANCGSGCGN